MKNNKKRKSNDNNNLNINNSKNKIRKNNNIEENIEINKNSKNIKNEEKKLKRKRIKRIIVFLLILIIIWLVFFSISLFKWNTIIKDIIKCENSVVLDATGNVVAVLGESRIQQNVKLNQVPKNLINAYVAIEDKNFYKHNGVNIKRTVAATGSYIIHGGKSSFGGSTITQQLVKNITGENESKISRKIKEWDRSFKTELVLSKDEIMETYLNIIYVGPNIYGVEKGAQYYFSKSASELNLLECAFLAGINNSPNSYNPFGKNDNSEKIKIRTTTVLKVMLEQGYINNTEYKSAILELENGINFRKGNLKPEGNSVYSYMVDATISSVINDLEENKKMSTSFATNYLYYSGLKVYCTQNSDIQKEMENECKKSKYSIKSKQNSEETSQTAMIIIDHNNGKVVGCVGGLGDKTTSRGFNRATQALRQTGSAIKPIAVLGPALEENIITPVTVYNDTKTTFENNYSPDDCENELGEITVKRAVESSQNIPFVKIMEQLTPEKSIKYMEKQGITTLVEGDCSLPLALGGLEKGLSPLQMAVAYATIANGGKYIEPIFYTRVENSYGKTVLKSKQKINKVYSEDTAYVLKELLTWPVKGENGTAKSCEIHNMETAAKTGTTNDNYDKWLCGFTKYYTAVTWFGFDVNESIDEGANSMANQIWTNVMNKVHEDLIPAKFEKVNSVQQIKICAKSGKIATEKCSDVYIEYFRKSKSINIVCDIKH